MTDDKQIFKVKRITQGCCGMVQNEIYDAEWDSGVGHYVVIIRADGSRTSPHWFGECFEVIK